MDRVASKTRVDIGQRSKAMHIALWGVQILLAVLFLMTGAMKAFMPLNVVAKTMRWVPDVPVGLVRFIGLAELAGALGLILPSATKIQPKLTPLAAVGLGVVVLLGAILHFIRGEGALTPLNFILAAMAAFVAWGRTQEAPISRGWHSGMLAHFRRFLLSLAVASFAFAQFAMGTMFTVPAIISHGDVGRSVLAGPPLTDWDFFRDLSWM